MTGFRPDELSQWLSVPWENGTPAGRITGISKDTRTLRAGDLYVAVRGENFDGHAFLQDAFVKGASGALICVDAVNPPGPVLRVPDTIAGLQQMACGYRTTWNATVIGITGSVGKTTVKEMCADVLSVTGRTHRTAGNYNNHIGLPLSMLSMPRDAQYGVFEIGMNRPGEIGPLTELLRPDIGILTEIGNAHRGNFRSVEEIAREKIRLLEGVSSSGKVISNRDGRWFPEMQAAVTAGLVTVSFGGAADYTGLPKGSDILEVAGVDYVMPVPGEHMMCNALLAIALGLEEGMQPEQVAEGLCRFKAPSMRWERSEIKGIRFINDAYNANPLSMRASLKTFSELSGGGGKWAVIGGMRELGDTEIPEHEQLGQFVDSLPGLDGVITVGALGKLIHCEKQPAFFQCNDAKDAALVLRENLSRGDQVLLKASRSERLERVLTDFEEI